jgi:DNA-binding CsgD family transcriptional regulator
VRSAASEGVRLAREQGDLYVLEIMLLNLGSAALLAGDLAGSQPLLAEALRMAGQIDDRVAQFYLLGAFGCHAALSGQARLAAQLLGAADGERGRVGASVMPFLAPSLAGAEESAVAKLGVARFAAEFEAGRLLDRDAAFGLALGKPAQAAVSAGGAVAARPASDSAGTGPLGRREADVARLVADGLTNKQIGTRLFISERTVDSHVRSILTKLGFSSRAQIAAWMASDR